MILSGAEVRTFIASQIYVVSRLDIEIPANEELVADPATKVCTVDVLFNPCTFLFNTESV